jgi:hypothetical protein
MWLSVDLRTDTRKTKDMCLVKFILRAQNVVSLGSTVNIIGSEVPI